MFKLGRKLGTSYTVSHEKQICLESKSARFSFSANDLSCYLNYMPEIRMCAYFLWF